jgi:hypothetical protein
MGPQDVECQQMRGHRNKIEHRPKGTDGTLDTEFFIENIKSSVVEEIDVSTESTEVDRGPDWLRRDDHFCCTLRRDLQD